MNVLVLTYFSFREGLMKSYTLPYLKIIHELYPEAKLSLVTHEKKHLAIDQSDRPAILRSLAEQNINWLPVDYIPFSTGALIQQAGEYKRLKKIILEEGITHIHCWGTPPGVMGYLLSRSTGIPLILDSYEPHAEAQLENGSWGKFSPGYLLLNYFERKMSRRASTLIYASKAMVNYAKNRFGVEDDRHIVKPACVDLKLFGWHNRINENLAKSLGLEDKRVMVYAGKFGGIYYEKEVFNLIKKLSSRWGDSFRTLLLTSTDRAEINLWCEKFGINTNVIVSKFVDHSEVSKYLGLGDFAFCPVKPVPSKRCCTPIKNGEYWALGLPCIIPEGIGDDSDIIAQYGAGIVVKSYSNDELERAIPLIGELLENGDKEELYRKIRPLAERYRTFELARIAYSTVYH